MHILQWITDNQTLLLALLVFGSRIWSHFEHKQTAKDVKGVKTDTEETKQQMAAIINGQS